MRGKSKANTKTYLVRDVELNARAWCAFEAQRPHTQLAGIEVFWNPATGRPWADIQRQHAIWGRCLRRMGLRYREPYQTRHTFATLALMAGANPSWVARQMGHVNAQMLFKVYSKWIDGADKSRERDKMNSVLGHNWATENGEITESVARSTSSVAEREGFEPSIHFWAYAPLAGECLRPLGHLSGQARDCTFPRRAPSINFRC